MMDLAAISLLMVLAGQADPVPATPSAMTITSPTDRPTEKGPAETFTGAVFVDQLLAARAPSRTGAGLVAFSPGARSHWHTHPYGQALVVVEGVGWVQAWGEARRQIRAGDVVWTPPGVKHWHGASRDQALRHIAITESRDGANVDWLEAVNDDQYQSDGN